MSATWMLQFNPCCRGDLKELIIIIIHHGEASISIENQRVQRIV